ncbi:hypothetical protein D1BOALGB6SA_10118 [Olavius sp. associated proteobacterium Delta 1]|nr:hypothetical protein D1BOALGB6SA_10118 [Olavius sp. associated proteobacterium Delta 1]
MTFQAIALIYNLIMFKKPGSEAAESEVQFKYLNRWEH